MGNVIGIIASGCPSGLMMGLIRERPIAALPFGGRYRLLDFPLSNMVNSGLRTVGIITPFHYRPVLDHLGAGKEWLLDRKTGGLFILPSSNREKAGGKFPLADLAGNLDFFHKDRAEHVIISCSNLVINLDFRPVLDFHQNQKADVTLIYHADGVAGEAGETLFLAPDHSGQVQEFNTGLTSGNGKVFLDMLVIKKDILLELLEGNAGEEDRELLGVIAAKVGQIRVFAYPFSGYVGRISSVVDYFKCNMDLLKPEIRRELFMESNKIHTKIADNPPTLYGHNALSSNSLVASGCKIDGTVENSIIFRQVQIKPGAVVKNSIVMQKCIIGRNVVLENVILDKFVRIKDHTVLQGHFDKPVVIEKTTGWGGE